MGLFKTAARRVLNGDLSQLEEAVGELKEVVQGQAWDNETLRETITMLELALQNQEWRLMTTIAQQEFSRPGLRAICELARIMYLKNPIIKRGVDVQRLYVWAQGVQITAKDQEINRVVQDFLDDERNQAELTSHQARSEKEKDLQLESNLFFVFFPNALSGRVRVRTIPADEIEEIIHNPEDAKEPWFYRRVWSQRALDGTMTTHTAFYPDWRYMPRSRLAGTPATALDGGRIIWDNPVYHVAVNRLGRWGVSEVYAGLDWALAYKSFLENLAGVWQALARWAHKLTTKGGARGVAAAKTKLNTTLSTSAGETNPPPVTGATFLQGEGVDLQPFRTAGATMSAEDGRRLFLMAAMVKGFPETFYSDVSVGTLATAKSLDRPTELQIIDRQTLWRDIHLAILRYQVAWAVKAPRGALRGLGKVVREPDGDQWLERVEWNEDVDPTIDLAFPPVLTPESKVTELVAATTLNGQMPAGTFDLRTFTRLAANELGIQDVDGLIAELFPEGEQPAADVPSAETPEQAEEAVREAYRELMTAVNGLTEYLREAGDA